MHLLMFWSGIAITSFGLLTSFNGGNGAGAVILGIAIVLLSRLWISKIKSKAKSGSNSEPTPTQESELTIPPSPELPMVTDFGEDEETLRAQVESVPEIRTRTNPSVPGIKFADRYAGRERPFTNTEDEQLLDFYNQGLNIVSIANGMVIDQKQITIRLIRLLLDPADAIEDEESASNNRRAYKKGEKDDIEAEYRKGHSIDMIAKAHGRTVLAIGWQLLERPSRPVSV